MRRPGVRSWHRFLLILIGFVLQTDADKQKRQIFREHVLPALGGKIPEEAFRTDRLALNRLNKEGISIPDGVVLEARHVHKPHNDVQSMPEVLKVYLTPDGRYVPPEGRYHYDHPKAVDTTYLNPSPAKHRHVERYRLPSSHGDHRNYNNGRNQAPVGSYNKDFNRYHQKVQNQQYNNYNNYVNTRRPLPQAVPRKPGIYKPIVTPLVLPASGQYFQHYPSWDFAYDWSSFYEPVADYSINKLDLYNTHQIITDYEGFLNVFHGRSSRNIKGGTKDSLNHSSFPEKNIHGKVPADSRSSGYRDPTKIPQTSFSCNGRTGTFADTETKCQVFHECTTWSKTSNFCPAGTAFSEEKKRCEWWNAVSCPN